LRVAPCLRAVIVFFAMIGNPFAGVRWCGVQGLRLCAWSLYLT